MRFGREVDFKVRVHNEAEEASGEEEDFTVLIAGATIITPRTAGTLSPERLGALHEKILVFGFTPFQRRREITESSEAACENSVLRRFSPQSFLLPVSKKIS